MSYFRTIEISNNAPDGLKFITVKSNNLSGRGDITLFEPKGEFLAYINEKEARILKAYGGLGKPIKETSIPSFLAPWVLPAIMAIGTVVTFMGNLQNQKNIVAGTKANQNQIINKNNLNILNLAILFIGNIA